ncbi:MAG TPA: phosphate-starvation-inducible PsiE family protein [Gammaproteobacteria bacterium]|nr:phosphate-starvation-inducible PsiE family protein [Gammaproteobacteria bacterium]
MKIQLLPSFEKLIGAVISVMLLFITLGIITGVVQLFLTLGDLLATKELAGQYQKIISEVLTLFILIELSRTLVDYFTTHRLRMTFIVDAAIVFLLREIMIKIFEHKITPEEIYALSTLLLVLGALRIGSIVVFQREKKMTEVGSQKQ